MKRFCALVIVALFCTGLSAKDKPKDLSKDQQIEFYKQGHEIRLAQLREAQAKGNMLASIVNQLLPMIGGNESERLGAEFQEWQKKLAGDSNCTIDPATAEWACQGEK